MRPETTSAHLDRDNAVQFFLRCITSHAISNKLGSYILHYNKVQAHLLIF